MNCEIFVEMQLGIDASNAPVLIFFPPWGFSDWVYDTSKGNWDWIAVFVTRIVSGASIQD